MDKSDNVMKKQFNLKSSLSEIPPLVKTILTCLKEKNVSDDILHDIKLATEEAAINAMKHGNKFNEEFPVTVYFEYGANKISIAVEDKGSGYDYKKLPDPTADEYIERGHGRGVFLILNLMDEVKFNKTGNRIEMVKYIKKR